ncbi:MULTISPECIES: hypothetical protein [Algoriphagus]|jgi:hypothetical protein|uniref:Uncharacterized protein n=1 Tax=Algoriphagus winogradskyi TaxID=237017 RepID=A0ABY1NSC9_9BACT|nr:MULTISPECIES: hypothetical protein [Algoriphagus]QYH39998.1 hypothetical protein GYM62_14825 [Algoriphagus sp. NBT04N3]SMP16953.1 hypothetical protein SAMN06265367_102692 [Algoriphagus winogradskyi]|tara:strand:- start:416 stop:643 length:228 start_codon:yes stop_codon:yes gene_type:complete
MNLSRKLTFEEERLREELVILEEHIRLNIRRICATNLKLPYERLAAGRRLKELCLLAISSLDDGDAIKLAACFRE